MNAISFGAATIRLSPAARSTRRAAMLALATVSCCTAATAGAATSPRYMFDARAALSRDSLDTPFHCPKPVQPIADMSAMAGFYTGERSQSVVDRKAMQRYVARTRAASDLTKALLALDVRYIRSARDRAAAGNCIVHQLRLWADKGAMLSGLAQNDPTSHRQAIMVMTWTGAAAANAYAIASSATPVAAQDKRAILGWFGQMQREITQEFTPRPDRTRKTRWLDQIANHSHAAGVTIGSLAALRGDRAGVNRAMEELRRTLTYTAPDGSFPNEMKRGARALHYQGFALLELAQLVALADANGVRLTPAGEAKLKAAARFTLAAFQNPALLAKRTGTVQEAAPDTIQWADVLLPHLRKTDPKLAAEIERVAAPKRPMRSGFIGLPMTDVFIGAKRL